MSSATVMWDVDDAVECVEDGRVQVGAVHTGACQGPRRCGPIGMFGGGRGAQRRTAALAESRFDKGGLKASRLGRFQGDVLDPEAKGGDRTEVHRGGGPGRAGQADRDVVVAEHAIQVLPHGYCRETTVEGDRGLLDVGVGAARTTRAPGSECSRCQRMDPAM